MCIALKHVFMQLQPQRIRTDLGSEFSNKNVSQLLKKWVLNILQLHILKTKISKYVYHKQQYKWEEILEDVTYSYNTTYHRRIHTSPDRRCTQ